MTLCQLIRSVERSLLRDCLFTLRLLPFLHAEQVCLLAEAIASRSARYSRRIVTRDTSSIRLYASDYNNLLRRWAVLDIVEGATAHSIDKVKAIPNNNHTPSQIAHSIATVSPSVNRLVRKTKHPPKVQYFLVIFKVI